MPKINRTTIKEVMDEEVIFQKLQAYDIENYLDDIPTKCHLHDIYYDSFIEECYSCIMESSSKFKE